MGSVYLFAWMVGYFYGTNVWKKHICWGLNSHCFHIIGDGNQPNSRVHIPKSRGPIECGMTIRQPWPWHICQSPQVILRRLKCKDAKTKNVERICAEGLFWVSTPVSFLVEMRWNDGNICLDFGQFFFEKNHRTFKSKDGAFFFKCSLAQGPTWYPNWNLSKLDNSHQEKIIKETKLCKI